MKKRWFLIGALVVALGQSGAIGSMIYGHASHLANGKEVVLESGFVDPRDLFRGHYVRLNLTVGELGKDKVKLDRKFKRKDVVYVELAKSDDIFWTATKLWHEIPAGSDKAFIKGKMRSSFGTGATIRISFPFDRYFAPKKRAKELEKFRRDQKLGVVLSLNEKGEGLIKGITVEGKVIYNEPLY